MDPLAAMAELERRYDGPIPEMQRRAVLLGSACAAQHHHAAAQARFFAGRLRRQVRAIRLCRADGGVVPGMIADLALYRRECRRWRALARSLQNPADGLP